MSAFEKHFSVSELAELWNFSDDKIRAIFLNEPGVIRLGKPETLKKRAYFTLRIPESVARRVHEKLTKVAA